jgi:error-prone DNA polymerase
VEGARARGVADAVIREVWDMMMGFDGYSFCKPHSASYTMVAYKSAFLRAHYPAEFMASVISNGGGYYSAFGYLSEARRMGLAILPPCINRSDIKYTGKGREIRVGLMQVKDLSADAAEAIVHERARNGPFGSFADFLNRTDRRVRLQDAMVLIKAGCFDAVAAGANRAGLVWEALRHFHIREGEDRPLALFSAPFPSARLKESACGPEEDRSYPRELLWRHELETFGFILSTHPLRLHADALRRLNYVKAKDLHRAVGRRVTTVGWQITGKTVHTQDGEPMKFVSFEDPTGIYETVFFPRVYHRFCHMLNATRPYLIKGRVQEEFGAVTLAVDWIGYLDE